MIDSVYVMLSVTHWIIGLVFGIIIWKWLEVVDRNV